MSTEIATVKKSDPFESEELEGFSKEAKNDIRIMMKAGVFSDSKDLYKSLSKVIIGQGMGLSPQLAVRGIILQSNGLPSFTANLMATLIKKSGIYDYSSKELYDDKGVFTGTEITVEKKRDGVWIHAGTTQFTLKDAGVAGLAAKDTFKKFPKNMCFARAISNACKWFCPDAFGGYTAYTPDEIPSNTVEIDGETLEPITLKKVIPKKSSSVKDIAVEDASFEEVNPSSHIELEAKIISLMDDTKSLNTQYFDHFGVSSYSEMTYEQLTQLQDLLEKKLKVQKL